MTVKSSFEARDGGANGSGTNEVLVNEVEQDLDRA